MPARLTVLALAWAFTACGASPSESNVSRVIESSDFVAVSAQGENLPSKLRPLIDAFGLMSMGCTGTHIGNGLILSAGHCFRSQREAADVCSRLTVDFGVRSGAQTYLQSKCVEVLAFEFSDTKDYALFKIAHVPRAKLEVDLNPETRLRSRVTVFGFPNWRPLEWSQYCELGESRIIYENVVSDFTHQCDTEAVSSGSAVIDAETLKIVGIHDGGILPWNYGTAIGKTPGLSNILLSRL